MRTKNDKFDDDFVKEMWAHAHQQMRDHKFRLVMTTPRAAYWKRDRDGATAIMTSKANGVPDVMRLDDQCRK